MNPPNSSTSNSDPAADPARRWIAGRTFAWLLVWLAALDIGASLIFAYPQDPGNVSPGRLALYFDYGRSMEGRLRRGTRADHEKTAPITLPGWYRPLTVVERPPKPGGRVVSIYGMSHAVRLADALQRTSHGLSGRSIGAPGATTNWAFGAYRRDTGRKKGDVAVLAIMSSTLPMITSMAPMNWNTSFAMPYTADRFRLETGRLMVVTPPYDRFDDYVATLNDPARWAAAKRTIARNDPFYDPWLLVQTPLDHSSLVRLMRRGWAQKRDRQWRNRVLDGAHFDAQSEAVLLANAIIAEFAREARQDGVLPVIYIVNNYGYGDQLYRALADTLAEGHIPFLSSHTVVDPKDARNYLQDTHFTDENDIRLAEALEELIVAQGTRAPA